MSAGRSDALSTRTPARRGRFPIQRFLIVCWPGLLAGALAISVWASIDDHFPGDVAVGLWLQAHDPGSEALIGFVRDVGSTPAGMVAVALFVAVLLARRQNGLAFVIGLMALGFLLQGLLKEVVDRPRTSVQFLDQRAGFGSQSFPSGHAMSSVLACGIALWLTLRMAWSQRWWGWLLRAGVAVWSVGVGLLSPWVAVTAGVHWPSDALGGTIWALIVLIPGVLALERTKRSDSERAFQERSAELGRFKDRFRGGPC